MRNFYSNLLILLFAGLFSLPAFSQEQYWTSRPSKEGIVTHKAVARQSFPKEFKLFDLNVAPLRQQLLSIVGDNPQRRTVVITVPNAIGKLEQFEVVEASNFEPTLQRQFPNIRAFSGKGIEDPAALLKISYSPEGIQTTVFRADAINEYVEKYSQNGNTYAVFQTIRRKGDLPWLCSTPDQQLALGVNNQVYLQRIESNAGQLKTMRLAQSVTAEYSNYFGAFSAAQVNLVLAAVNATMTRTNGCYEKDLAVHLNLVPNTTSVFYYDPLTDPYSPSSQMNLWNNQLQSTLTAVIGEANYDIGHLFGATGGGGNAGCIGCVCVDGQKGRGITSPADGIPQGDNFDIDYVAHEIGHQLGANHTFSFGLELGGLHNKEVGSGITIMGYAGITSFDVAPHSIDIFHFQSIQQVQDNLATKTCPVTTSLAGTNATPVIAALTPYTIPISTPFELTGSATDANTGDVLTYCWEQNDAANSTVTGANSVAFPTKLVGPNWLTFPATTSPTRIFPRLATILAGLSVTGPLPGGDAIANTEALSSVDRILNFRLTVRDNAPYSSTAPIRVGQTAYSDVAITVSSAVGPFLITSRNTAATLTAGTTETLTWSVNGTTGAPTNTANVDIYISTNGGTTFTLLIPNTTNDGTESFTVPNTPSTTVRFKVKATNNVYFDINNANLTIIPPPFGFTFNTTVPATAACPAPATMGITLGTASNGGFTGNVTLSASGNPAGTTVSFSPGTIAVGESTTVTLSGANTLNAGTYTIVVTGVTTGAPNQTANLSFTVNAGNGPAITTQPANQSACLGNNASFTIASTGTYQWQVNTGSGFANISGATAATYTVSGVTASMSGNTYRCIVAGQCGNATSSSATLTVNTLPSVVTQPTSLAQCTGTAASFSVGAAGTALTYQWQVSTDGGLTYSNILGETGVTYTIASTVLSQNNNRYRCVVSGTCSPSATSDAATLTLSAAPTITAQPSPTAVICERASTSFVVAATTPVGTLTYQWQASANGGATWAPVNGATSGTFNQSNVPASQNGYIFRCAVTTSCGTIFSTNVALTVNTYPVISFSTVEELCLSDRPVALTATPAGGAFSGTGVAVSAFNPRTAGLGVKTVTYTASNAGCQSTLSRSIIVEQCAERQIPLPNSASLTLYPNPNTGKFGIRINTDLYNRFSIKVYNNLGQLVRKQEISNVFYGQVVNLDMSSLPAGTFHLLFVNDEVAPAVSRTISMVIYK
ncbi:MAG: T9SS type A sorting domain-containing protein [Bacteroidetes bacterium]|nr:T9SS type A sorting domain-containing protein [Bacteroidota bacterium]